MGCKYVMLCADHDVHFCAISMLQGQWRQWPGWHGQGVNVKFCELIMMSISVLFLCNRSSGGGGRGGLGRI